MPLTLQRSYLVKQSNANNAFSFICSKKGSDANSSFEKQRTSSISFSSIFNTEKSSMNPIYSKIVSSLSAKIKKGLFKEEDKMVGG